VLSGGRSMKNVLRVIHEFPSMITVGVLRSLRFVKYHEMLKKLGGKVLEIYEELL